MSKIVGIDLGTTNSKDKKLFARRFLFGSKFNSHNIGNNNQSTGNQEQSSPNLGTINNGVKLFSCHNDFVIASTLAKIQSCYNNYERILDKPE